MIKFAAMYQMMSQGTGDLLLDVCSDFWDGCDVIPLTDIERFEIINNILGSLRF